MKVNILCWLFIGLLVISCSQPKVEKNKKPNILFIALDDLRPELGCYGHPVVKSPNIDKLASEGLMFTNSYCNIPVCGASRSSLLTGLRPSRTRFLDYKTEMEVDVPGAITIPGHFKDNGYNTVSLGKIAHHQFDNGDHWSEKPWRAPWQVVNNTLIWQDYVLEENLEIASKDNGYGPAFEKSNSHDTAYIDGKAAERAIRDIKRLAKSDKPFFLGVGFYKPHLPFNAPSKYWELYNEEDIKTASNHFWPKDAPKAAYHGYGEMRAYSNIPNQGDMPLDLAKKLRHGYYAAVSYSDALVGKVLKALEETGEADNTIIILWGDHGWNLGEHTLWGKVCNFKNALRTPLIIKLPDNLKGKAVEGLVEFVDIFPTLCDLAGISTPDQVQGKSFLPLLQNPEQPWKEAIFCQWEKGATVKTQRYAYTEWTTDEGEVYSRMLYDHLYDPQENINIVDNEENVDLVKKLSKMLEENNKTLK